MKLKLILTLLFFVMACSRLEGQAIKTLADSLTAGQWGQLTGVSDLVLSSGGTSTGEHLTFNHNPAGWDIGQGKGYMFAAGHGLSTAPWLFRYTASSNTWEKLLETNAGNGHGYDHAAFDPWRRRLYLREYAGNRIWAWDTATDTALGYLTTAPYDLGNVAEGVVWFDGLYGSGVSTSLTQGGLLVYSGESLSGTQAHIWEPNKGTGSSAWSEINNVLPAPTAANYHTWAEYSRAYNVAFMGGGNNQPRKVAVITASRVVQSVPDAPVDIRIQKANATVDPRSGKLIVYGEGPQFWELGRNSSDTAWVWTQLAAPPSTITADSGLGDPGGATVRSISSMAIPDYGVIYYIRCQGVSTPCRHYLYKHTESDFDIRARQGGVLSARKMDTAADLYYTWDNSSSVLNSYMSGRSRYTVCANVGSCLGNTAGIELGGSALFPEIDRTVKPNNSSAGSLLFRTPSMVGTPDPFYWTSPIQFNDRTSPWKYIAPGSPDGNVLWSQFKLRANDQYLTSLNESCSSGCSPKFSIMFGNPPNGSPASTIEVTWVIDNRSDKQGLRIPAQYGQIGGDDYGTQNAVSCNSSPWTNCVKLTPETWYTFTTKYTVNAPPKVTAGCVGGATSRVESWIGTTKVIDNPCASINYGSSDGDGLGSITFLPYTTGRTPTAHAEGRLWIADVIISTSAINTGPSSDTTPPAKPTGVRIQ